MTFQLEAWADNWFAAYLGTELLVEDSVPITTERSFNAERVTFRADYPLHLNFVLRDFMENDSGLEYIGRGNQQMGDGGFIMQLTETGSGDIVEVSNRTWACTVIHQAPLDKACEEEAMPVPGEGPCGFNAVDEPPGWKAPSFDDRGWVSTTAHDEQSVNPRQGYYEIDWDERAELIWGPDLETDNTILCRVTVDGESSLRLSRPAGDSGQTVGLTEMTTTLTRARMTSLRFEDDEGGDFRRVYDRDPR